MLLVGLDAASQPENFGFAIGTLSRDRIDLREAGLLSTKGVPDALSDVVAPRLREADHALVAVDAPLGWPVGLWRSLADHHAGEPIHVDKRELFSRETDRVVTEKVGKRPLEVGADKIARAAHTANLVLARLRELVQRPIPLVWTPGFQGLGTIEVYPGATLKARRLENSGYKKSDEASKAVRLRIAECVRDELPALGRFTDVKVDVFDACLCLLAAKDFLRCATLQPDDLELARREGWIWVRDPDQ